MNHAQSGALMGTGVGALAGAAIGDAAGNAGAGALIGGLTGAMAGGIIGDSQDARNERDFAYMQRDGAVAQAQFMAHQQQSQALTNFELIRLTQSGLSEDVIINQIASRGGKFDLSTEAIIGLKANGVSDRVIMAAQSARPPAANIAGGPYPGPDVVVVQPAPPPVFIEPLPPPAVVFGWGPPPPPWRHRPYPHYHRGPRSSVGVSIGF